ncbi:MAG: HDIG domain-containing metalloprotein, partial [Terriglobales bacterium]
NDTARVVLKDGTFADFAGCVGGSIETDIRRRDFTINALAWDARKPDSIIDLVNGADDLAALRIRAVSENSIVEDPLRILRAFRFSASLGARIDDETLEFIKRHAQRLSTVAAERISYELFTMLGVHVTAPVVELMAISGVLEVIFPELVPTRKVTANAFHHLGLFEHSIETIPQLELKLPEVPQWVVEESDGELSSGVTRLAATKLACILHDIGKPETWIINEEGRHTFYGHDKLGADMCEVVSERLKWSRPVAKMIVNLVRWHLRPGALYHQGPPTDKAIRRFYRSIGTDTPALMLLAFADFGATRGPGLMGENRTDLERNLFDLLDGYREYRQEALTRVKLLNGSQVMALLELKPGPI